MNFHVKEDGTSPVIGTILLVAIAVILVAIILTVVMGFSGDTNDKKIGLNAKAGAGTNATLILYGGDSIDELVKLEMIDQNSPDGEYVEFWNITNGSAYVGIPYAVENVARPGEDMAAYDTRINVKGTFADGTETILLVQPMTFLNVESGGTRVELHNLIIPYDIYGEKYGGSIRGNFQYSFAPSYDSNLTPISFTMYHRKAGTNDEPIPSYDNQPFESFIYNPEYPELQSLGFNIFGLTQNTTYEVWAEIVYYDATTGKTRTAVAHTIWTTGKTKISLRAFGSPYNGYLAYNINIHVYLNNYDHVYESKHFEVYYKKSGSEIWDLASFTIVSNFHSDQYEEQLVHLAVPVDELGLYDAYVLCETKSGEIIKGVQRLSDVYDGFMVWDVGSEGGP